ncbi:class I SAM-dependent methyltransferase [Candidatus Solincola sp.]
MDISRSRVWLRGVIKAWAKRVFGGTVVWRIAQKVRHSLPRRGVRVALHALYRKILLCLLPRDTAYRWAQSQIQNQNFYGADYFDARDKSGKESGCIGGYPEVEDFGRLALLAKELLEVKSALDIGCAKGFQVKALRLEGIDAWGIDLSEYAISTAPDEVRPWLKVCSIQEADFPAGSFELVLAMELLEHIPLTDIEEVIRKLYFFTSRFVLATIPSFGPNPYGMDGWLEEKINPRKIPRYRDHLIDLAEMKHLIVDSQGLPQHGHMLIASYDWWTSLFTRYGFQRRGDLEREINRRLVLAREGKWCCYLFEKVEPGGEGVKPLRLEEGDFVHRGGRWESLTHLLPRGIYCLSVELDMPGVGRVRPVDERLLSLVCLSKDGERIHAQRLVTKRELPGKRGNGAFKTSLVCAVDGDAEIILRLEPGPGALCRPLSALYTPLGKET